MSAREAVSGIGRRGRRMKAVSGLAVLITGAARGMGAIYARRAAAEGARAVILWDIDLRALDELTDELVSQGVRVLAHRVDISRPKEIRAAAAHVRSDVGAPDVIINNAGIVRGEPFWRHEPTRDIEETFRINTLAPMWITREFLPEMIDDPHTPKRVLNVASAAATLPNPGMTVYASSKWALLGWSESLRLELAKHGHDHIAVTAFCPSYVSTGMFEGARGPLLTPILSPAKATEAAWRGMLRKRPLVLTPWTVRLSMMLRGVLPVGWFDALAGRVFGVYSSMDAFTGRRSGAR